MDGQDNDDRREHVESNEGKPVAVPAEDETEPSAEAENKSEQNLEASGNLSETADSALESGASSSKITKVFSQDTIKSEDSEFTSSGFETDRTSKPEAKAPGEKGTNKGIQPKCSKSMLELPTISVEFGSGKPNINLSRSLSDIKEDPNVNLNLEGNQSESSMSTNADKDSKAEESSSTYSESKCKPDLNKELLPAQPVDSNVGVQPPPSNTANVAIPRNRYLEEMELAHFLQDNVLINELLLNAGLDEDIPVANIGDNPQDNEDHDENIEIPEPDPANENNQNPEQPAAVPNVDWNRLYPGKSGNLMAAFAILGFLLLAVIVYFILRLIEYLLGIKIVSS